MCNVKLYVDITCIINKHIKFYENILAKIYEIAQKTACK